jgi:hypothetical protein
LKAKKGEKHINLYSISCWEKLKYLNVPVVETRKIQPQEATIAQFKMVAFTGISNVGWICSKCRDKKMALSLEKAQVRREDVWKTAFRIKNDRNGEIIRKASAAVSDLIACLLISKDRYLKKISGHFEWNALS